MPSPTDRCVLAAQGAGIVADLPAWSGGGRLDRDACPGATRTPSADALDNIARPGTPRGSIPTRGDGPAMDGR